MEGGWLLLILIELFLCLSCTYFCLSVLRRIQPSSNLNENGDMMWGASCIGVI